MSRGCPVADPAAELDVVRRQLGRQPRAVLGVAHRCPCGLPDVVETAPRLEDGTPFPTLYYLTCPRAAAAISRLEGSGVMREMTARLGTDPDLAAAYRAAHRDYLARRDTHGPLPGDPSAGGMPDRVKCLHVLVAHSLAAGPGVNPFGDEALAAIGDWSARGPCVEPSPDRGQASGAGQAPCADQAPGDRTGRERGPGDRGGKPDLGTRAERPDNGGRRGGEVSSGGRPAGGPG